MPSMRVRAAVVLGSVPVLLAAAIGPARATPPTAPAAQPAAQQTARPAPPAAPPTAQRSLPEGPWPPSEVLATDPGIAASAATAAAAPATPCPPSSPGVHSSAPGVTGAARTVALTFDDGPGVTTQSILTILQRYGVPATFFNLGLNSTVRPTLVRSEVTAGYAVGNHTWDHPELPTLTAAGQAAEMDRATTEQKDLVAVGPCLFRPPYGEYDSTTLSVAQQRRMTVWNWSVDTEDWKAGTSTATSWVDRIVSRAVAGGSQAHPVVLMHNPPAGVPATVIALPRIIDYYRAHGYRFVDLLGRTGAAAAPAAATTAAGLHVLVRDGNGNGAVRTLRGSTWSGWTGLGGPITGGPGAAADGPGSMVAAAVGTNNWTYHQTVPDPGPASGWSSLAGVATSKPAVAVGPDGTVSVVIRGGNGQAYLRQRVGGRWGAAWQSLGGLLDPVAPGVAATAAGVLAVGCIGTDHAFYVKTRSAAGVWAPAWRRVGGVISSDVALSATADGSRLVAVVRGGGMNGYVSVSDAGATSWSAWTNIGGGLASAPAVTVDGGALEVFVVGFTDRLYRRTATDGTAVTGWTGAWQQLP